MPSYTPPEGWAEYARKRRATETPEQREKRLKRMRERYHRKVATETPEQREKRLEQMRKRQRECYRRKHGEVGGPGGRIYDAPMQHVNFKAPQWMVDALRDYGAGKLGSGIRRLVEEHLSDTD